MVKVDDTALAVTDSGGCGIPVVYLNGCYADSSHWKPVIRRLGSSYRHITYDERARGKSKKSSDYSFEACLRDIDIVIEARGVVRPLLVGWSYGGTLALYYAGKAPEHVAGVVVVDSLPVGLTGDAGRERIRKLFRRYRMLFPLASRFGLAARMTADQHAEVNIEANEMSAASVPLLEQLTCEVRYILATGGHMGAEDDEMEAARAALDDILRCNPHLRVSAKVASNHSHILRRDFLAVANAVCELSAGRE